MSKKNIVNNQVAQTAIIMSAKARSLQNIANQFTIKGDNERSSKLNALASRINKSVTLLESHAGKWD